MNVAEDCRAWNQCSAIWIAGKNERFFDITTITSPQQHNKNSSTSTKFVSLHPFDHEDFLQLSQGSQAWLP
jgi:hypothetical protein